jgi:hypothetical protein
MWTSKRDRRALPLSMPEMDDTSDRNAAMHQHLPRQHILLLRQEIALR